MRRSLAVLVIGAALASGCVHNRANQYAYAPPLAPPVYPQPQAVAQPVVSPAPGPVVGAPVVAPATPFATGAPLSAAEGVVPAYPDGSCPPCAGTTAVPVVYEGAVQTTPCPQ